MLNGKTALVTGAGRGIGREIALRLARDGAFVILHYGNSKNGAEAVLAEMGGPDTGFLVQADLADAQAIAPMFDRIDADLAACGRKGIDILVNNAGVGTPEDLDSITPEAFDRVFAINVRAPLFVAQQAARRMGEGGRIVNISSMVATRVYGGFAVAYGATKAAIDYMSRSMAVTLGPRGITVNSLAPGATDTDFIGGVLADEAMAAHLRSQTALGSISSPRDIANVVALIVSADAQWITGEAIRASGGTLL